MALFGKRKPISSLRALGLKVPARALPQVQPILLLHALIGFSQTVNSSAAQLEAMARTLITDGQQRLRALRQAAPHLRLPLEHLLQMVYPGDENREHLSEAESAVQAMLEMWVGLMLRWLSERTCQFCPSASSIVRKLVLSANAPVRSCHVPPLPPLRVRACPTY